VVSAADPLRSLISVFQTGAATFLSSSSLFTLTRAEWTPFQTHCYSENQVAPGIELGPLGYQPGTLTTRPQGWSLAVPHVTYKSSDVSITYIGGRSVDIVRLRTKGHGICP
jgi:hypothetical protein